MAQSTDFEDRHAESSQAELENQQPMDTDAKTVRIERDNRIFAQALGGMQQERTERSHPRRMDRSRSRSPTRRRDRSYDRQHYRPHDRQHDRPYDRHDRYEQHDERRSRYSDRSDHRNVLSRLGRRVDEPQDRETVFDRLGRSDRLGRPRPTRPMKERCTFWPACNNGDHCKFFHPTALCRNYPNCPYPATECMYIHPEEQPSLASVPVPAYTAPPCKFFPNCKNQACPFSHPKKVPVPCKDGEYCARPGCHFMHPGDSDPAICKFDGFCTRADCFYTHTVPPGSSANTTSAQPAKSVRLFSVPDDEIVERITVGNSADMIKRQPTPQQEDVNVATDK